MPRLPLAILLALLLGAAGFGIAELAEANKLRQSLAGLDRDSAALRQRIRELEKLNGELAARLDRGSTSHATTPAETATGNEGTSEEDTGRNRFSANGRRFAAALSNPAVQKLMAMQQKAALDSRYATLFKQLNLSPADLEKFKNLLVEKQSAVMDVIAAARTEGMNPWANRDEVRQLVQNTQAEVDNNIRATLGDTAYSEYKNYETTLPQRNVVDQLGQRLGYSATPLTDTQAEQLVQILAQTASPGNTGSDAPFGQILAGGPRGATASMGAGARISDAAITQAQGVLSPPQVAALQSLQQEQQAGAQLMQQMRANFDGRSQTNTATTAPPRPPGN